MYIRFGYYLYIISNPKNIVATNIKVFRLGYK
jgi:hypothetical protein